MEKTCHLSILYLRRNNMDLEMLPTSLLMAREKHCIGSRGARERRWDEEEGKEGWMMVN